MNTKRTTVGLREMTDNHPGTIAAILAEREPGRRIREMGIIIGSKITVRGKSLLKDPVAVGVLDTTLPLRINEADYISTHIREN